LKNSYNLNEDLKVSLSEWFKDRGIPSWRDDLDLLLAKLNISTPTELLDKEFGLSLSNQYWIKSIGSEIEYKDINFFEHDFEDSEFRNTTFSDTRKSNIKISLISPNNTTDGRLKKHGLLKIEKDIYLKVDTRTKLCSLLMKY